jgi:hypothetical protein
MITVRPVWENGYANLATGNEVDIRRPVIEIQNDLIRLETAPSAA